MTTTTLYQYDSKTGEFLHPRPAQTRPNGDPILDVLGATPTAPPADIPAKHVACWTEDEWEVAEDHRQKMDEQGRMIDDTGTKYWLPAEDDFRSEGRYTKELGPLPEGAELERPEKPLMVAQEEKKREIAAAHERALAGAVALNDPTPSTVAVESSLLAVTDSEGLEWVRDQLTIRRAELEAQVQAATSVAQVEAITVSYSV